MMSGEWRQQLQVSTQGARSSSMTTSKLAGPPSSSRFGLNHRPSLEHRPFTDPNRLAPEDAFFAHSPPRRREEPYRRPTATFSTVDHTTIRGSSSRRHIDKERGRSGSRRRKGEWKKLLWVKQSYPDNYTDPPTFLSHLERNPRLLPYDFWPLVADSTVIVQHISSVAIFICCFVGIIQERISPVSVVSWGSVGTVLGWVLWDFWVGQQEGAKVPIEAALPVVANDEGHADATAIASGASSPALVSPPQSFQTKAVQGQSSGLALSTTNLARGGHAHSLSQTSINSVSSGPSPTLSSASNATGNFSNHNHSFAYSPSSSILSPRNLQRLSTAKSAVLIYCALLGLSPILKSLTKSTTSDSIWAMSCWLILTNIFFFDYGGGVGVKFPASLSTNAALMASTVLASRLPSTTHVFSLTLFSIEVFGLFPVFRRHLRHISWRGHLLLTLALVVGAGAGMGIVLSGNGDRWKRIVWGVMAWGLGSGVGMGGCSWWLIGLQKYKNVVIGPWDPARPVIKGGWE